MQNYSLTRKSTPSYRIPTTWTNTGRYVCICVHASAWRNQNHSWARREVNFGPASWKTALVTWQYDEKDHHHTKVSLHLMWPLGTIIGRYLRIFCGSQQHCQMCEQAYQNEDNWGHGPIRHSHCFSVSCISKYVASLSSVFIIPVGKRILFFLPWQNTHKRCLWYPVMSFWPISSLNAIKAAN